MALHSSNLDYYDRMQELEERLKRSEEERMLLQRQYDLLMQANQEKERARVSVVEARYKRFLDEDKRRRDRNSSLLQALDRIDSHTASLAAKTERMRALRKHYETFIAHTYPAWHSGIERPYCPLAAIAPAPNVMARVTDVTDYHTESYPDPGDYSETQYHALPSVTSKPYCPIASPLCRSDLAIASREDCPVVGRSTYRSGSSAIRSASLSPSRVRDLSSQYDSDKISSFKNYDLYSPPKSPDVRQSSRLKNESHFSRSEAITSPRPSRYLGNIYQGFGEGKQTRYQPISPTSHRILDYDHGISDIEVDQNTSGDLLNLSNLSLSDDGLNERDDSPLPYSGLHSYSSPRDFTAPKKSPSVSLPLPSSSLRHVSSRDIFIPKRSSALSPSIFTGSSPKSILSPRSRKSDIPSSLPLSDSVQRIILSTDDLDSRRSDTSPSPRRQKPTWQTFRPSYLAPPPRNTIRRSVTFTEPEYESPCIFRDEDVGLYSGSYGSLRRHSPSLPISNWESSDHERFLRDKQGREKDAFREKIERLKELIQENKDQEGSMTDAVLTPMSKLDASQPKLKDYDQHEKSRENSLDRNWKVSQSRRPSIAREVGSDSEEQFPKVEDTSSLQEKISEALQHTVKSAENDDEPSETISDKEQWSGQFNEKDEDAKEKVKISEAQDDTHNFTKFDGSKNPLQNTDLINDDITDMNETPTLKSEIDVLGENLSPKSEKEVERIIYDDNSNQEQGLDDLYQSESKLQDKEVSDYALKDSKQKKNVHDALDEEDQLPKEPSDIDQNNKYEHEEETNSDIQSDQHQGNEQQGDQPQEDQEKLVDYPENYTYDGGQQQQEWTVNADGGTQDVPQNMQYTYEQSEPPSAAYEEQKQDQTALGQDSDFEQYPTDSEQNQQSYEKYAPDANQQPPMQEKYEEPGYSAYQEPQQATESGNDYQNYAEDPNQYQQSYQTYPEDQQYSEQPDQNYTAGDQNTYQYSQDPTKTQYEYEGQEYNYQQNQDTYNYPQDQNYQQDPAYQQDPSYQQDQSYQDQSYQQDQQYQQDPNYQQEQQYQETGYDGSQQYEGYQPGPDDLSEDTTQSTDLKYQGQYEGGDSTDQQHTLDQYRAILGTDPSSEPVYSDSSELENQMAAVVGQTGNPASSVAEPATPSPPTPSTPTAASGTGKGKPGAKKKPQLTRKQSSVTPENAPAVGQQQSDSDFDISSSH